jgi:tRNA(Ile)-lysidine synthase
MAAFTPFEPQPRLAAAVSGGADSLALAVLLHDWAKALGGEVVGLVVDHGLRAGSGAEARAVAAQLAGLGLESHVLRRAGPRPRANVQATARTARYALLTAWCARHGVLHLVLGHHQQDQAETLLLRLGRGSGLDGLAGMARLVERPRLRLLRPLLDVPRDRLRATLRARGIDWSEDPSNRDPAHARVRMRDLAPGLAQEGLTAPRLAKTAAHLGRARAALEDAVGGLLARAAMPDPAGFVWLDPAVFRDAPAEVRLRALARALMTVSGGAYPPRLASLERLDARVAGGLKRGATLGGCRVLPRRGRVLLVREPAGAESVAVAPGVTLDWDGRFQVRLRRAAGPARRVGLRLGPLGGSGWAQIAAATPLLGKTPIPPPARASLPTLFDRRGVLEVPLLGYNRRPNTPVLLRVCRFAPRNSLTSPAFTVA